MWSFLSLSAAAALALATPAALAEEDYAAWETLPRSFPSTGGNGIVIGEYNPVLVGDRCVTRFTATEPNGTVHTNYALFEAVPTAGGGTLCVNGRWRGVEGGSSGTTPLRVFLKDGMVRRSP